MPTAPEVFEAAREHFPAGDEVHTGAQILYGWLTRYQRRLLAEIAHWSPGAVAEDAEILLAGYDFNAGAGLPPHLRIHAGTVHPFGARSPVELDLVGFDQRFGGRSWPQAYVRGDRLYLIGDDPRWQAVERVVVHLFPAGPALTPQAPNLILPGEPTETCALELAVRMAARLQQPDRASDLGQLREHAALAEQAYIDDVTGRRRARVGYTETVW
jgi:hypothetical protein